MRPLAFPLAILLSLAALPALAAEEGPVVLTLRAETEVTGADAQGKKVVKRVPVTTAVPGTAVIYTLSYRNRGATPAERVVLVNPVPQHMVYLEGSAFGPGAAIEFSVDGGKAFGPADSLRVKGPDGKQRPAVASDFTHLRWTLGQPLAPGASGEAGFRAVLK